MPVTFQFQEIRSQLFGKIYRPVALIDFKHKVDDLWVPVLMIIDTGADYSILPRAYARPLGIDLANDCSEYQTFGIGGSEKIFLYRGQTVRIDKSTRAIPVGFLDREAGPALLGRHEFLETFRVVFDHHITSFELPGKRTRRAR